MPWSDKHNQEQADVAQLDLMNIATLKEIEHLLALAESFADPIMLDFGDKPRTWSEA